MTDPVARRLERESAARREAERIAEDALRRAFVANNELQALNQALDAKVAERTERLERFASMVSHDLQQPLASVRLRLEVLRRRVEHEDVQAACNQMDAALREMGRFIQDVLEYSRTGELTPAEPVQLPPILDRLALMFGGRLQGGRIEWQDLPAVMADTTQVEHVFQNLLDNAIKYRGEEAPFIRITGHVVDGYAVLRFEDNGKGIRPEDIARLFEPFARGEGETVKGHGIGLATVRRLLELRGGSIHAEVLERGTAFVVRLPAA